MLKLTRRIENLPEKKSIPAAVYTKCRHLYRAPSTALDGILHELENLGWMVCRCEFQSDTHIADICRRDSNKKDIVVITKDSDLLVYEDIDSITMPVGRAHELTTFKKDDVLASLSLPSARHLLLTAILTRNDYSAPIPSYGLHRNADIVKNMEIDEPSSSDAVSAITNSIPEYLATVKKPHSKSTKSYEHAITAFAGCKEEWSATATPSTSTHEDIRKLLRELEAKKLARIQSSNRQPQAPQAHEPAGPAQSNTRAGKRKRRKRKRPNRCKSKSAWKQSR
jgi:hypothetical protein